MRDRCTVGTGLEVDKDEMYEEWKAWCEAEGRARASTKSVFARDLRAAYPSITDKRPREGDERRRIFDGITLGKHSQRPRTTLDQGGEDATPVQGRDPQSRRSEGVVQGGPGSSAMYTAPAPEPGWRRLQREAGEEPETDEAVALQLVKTVLGATEVDPGGEVSA